MSSLPTVLLLALMPGVGNFIGGLAAEVRRPSQQFLNWALHAASGIVIAIISVELMPKALGSLSGWWIALAFAFGGVGYLLLQTFVERLQPQGGSSGRSRMWMIYAAVAVDLTSDGLMLGAGSAVSPRLAIVLAAGQVLADVPEGYAAVANFRDKGVPRARRLLFSLSFFLYVIGAAIAAHYLLSDAPNAAKMFALVFVAGLLTVAAVEDMLEEAHSAHEDSRHSVLAFIGGFTLFTLVSTALHEVVRSW